MESADHKKLIDRIRKLYAMSQEDVSSPHEAEIAMRRCQSLMDRFGVTEADLTTSEFGARNIGRKFRALPSHVRALGAAVALLHDCICVRSDTIEFRGFSIDAEIASLTYAYLTGAMERSLKLHKRQGSVSAGRAASFDYRVGYALAVLDRARIICDERQIPADNRATGSTATASTDGKSLALRKQKIVREACMQGLVHERPKTIRYRSGDAHRAGASDGAAVSLDKQINSDRPRALGS